MRPGELVRCWLLFAGVALGMPGLWRRQASTTDSCTCPANGPVTATLLQYTIVTSTTTSTTDGGTITQQGSISTEVVTITSGATVTVTSDTVSFTDPANTQTITQQITSTSTITNTATITTCTVSANPKMRRQNANSSSSNSGSTTDNRPTVTFTSTISSRLVTCTCSPRPQTTTLAGASSCSCPATTATTVTTTSFYTGTAMVIYVTATQITMTYTPTVTVTSTTQATVTSGVEASTEVTANPSTVTTQSTTTVFATVSSTLTINSCSSSSTTQSSSSTVSSAIGPTSSAPGTFACNSTAYFIDTVNSKVNFYNIDLNTGQTFLVNGNLGGTAYTNLNGMGFNPLDNFLYAIATTTTSGTYAVVRVEISNTATEILRFTASAAPGTIGDIDTNGQFWFSGTGTSWYHVDLAPGSSTYGTMIGSGTMTLSNYAVADWSYLPGQGNYLWTLARQTSNNYLGLLRWSMTDHTWSVSQTFTNYAISNTIIATWGSNNGTLWGYQATSGTITQYDFGSQPYQLSQGLTGITSGDGARCGLTP